MANGRAGRRNGDGVNPDTGERARRGAQPFAPGGARRARRFRGAADGERPPSEPSGSLAGRATASSTCSSFRKLKATVKVILWHEYDLLMAGRGSTPRSPLGRAVQRQGALAQGRVRLARPGTQRGISRCHSRVPRVAREPSRRSRRVISRRPNGSSRPRTQEARGGVSRRRSSTPGGGSGRCLPMPSGQRGRRNARLAGHSALESSGNKLAGDSALSLKRWRVGGGRRRAGMGGQCPAFLGT